MLVFCLKLIITPNSSILNHDEASAVQHRGEPVTREIEASGSVEYQTHDRPHFTSPYVHNIIYANFLRHNFALQCWLCIVFGRPNLWTRQKHLFTVEPHLRYNSPFHPSMKYGGGWSFTCDIIVRFTHLWSMVEVLAVQYSQSSYAAETPDRNRGFSVWHA